MQLKLSAHVLLIGNDSIEFNMNNNSCILSYMPHDIRVIIPIEDEWKRLMSQQDCGCER